MPTPSTDTQELLAAVMACDIAGLPCDPDIAAPADAAAGFRIAYALGGGVTLDVTHDPDRAIFVLRADIGVLPPESGALAVLALKANAVFAERRALFCVDPASGALVLRADHPSADVDVAALAFDIARLGETALGWREWVEHPERVASAAADAIGTEPPPRALRV